MIITGNHNHNGNYIVSTNTNNGSGNGYISLISLCRFKEWLEKNQSNSLDNRLKLIRFVDLIWCVDVWILVFSVKFKFTYH